MTRELTVGIVILIILGFAFMCMNNDTYFMGGFVCLIFAATLIVALIIALSHKRAEKA